MDLILFTKLYELDGSFDIGSIIPTYPEIADTNSLSYCWGVGGGGTGVGAGFFFLWWKSIWIWKLDTKRQKEITINIFKTLIIF